MFDDMFPDERAASVGQLTLRLMPEPQAPGFFTGLGSALADSIPYAAVSGAGAWAQVLDAYGKAAAFRDAPAAAALSHRAAPDLQQLRADTVDQMGDSEDARRLRRVAKDYDPDPQAVGLAGQIVHGVASSLAKAGFYTLAGGPLAPVLYGADIGVGRAGELVDQGVGAGTASAAGAVSGVTAAVGLRLPAALGATRLQSAAIGAVVNPALNVAEVGGIHQILQHADYPQIAARYDPLDPVSLAVASVTGAAFGAGFHGAKASAARPADAPTLTPDGHAAALAMNEVRTREADTLVDPANVQALTDATDAQALARAQVDAGEPVSVAHLVQPDAIAPEAARRQALARIVDDLRAELLAEAGNRADPGDIPAARAHLASLQNDIERIQADSVFKAEAKAQQRQRGLSRKQAEAAAREAIGQRRADLQAQAERFTNFIEANRRAALAEQDIAVLNRGQIPERFQDRVDMATAQASRGTLAPAPVAGGGSSDGIEPILQALDAMTPAGAPVAGLVRRVIDAVSGRDSQAQPAQGTPRKGTPEQAQALEIAGRMPDAMIPTGKLDADGNPIHASAAEMIRHAADVERQAQTETRAFQAAVTCAMRFPQ